MSETIGVLAVQGDFEKHLQALAALGVPESKRVQVRTLESLKGVDRLIVPGGESTTVSLLLEIHGLGDAIRSRVARGMPIFGTCMGLIVMARTDPAERARRLDVLDVSVRRNAFGAQVHSFEDRVRFEPEDREVTGVFIRAPIVEEVGHDVEVIAEYEGKVVGVRQDRRVGIAFHPELTDDYSVHEWFLKK